jgi:hypothetical protein
VILAAVLFTMHTSLGYFELWQIAQISFLLLALSASLWVFVRVVAACFWLPEYLRKKELEKSRKKE